MQIDTNLPGIRSLTLPSPIANFPALMEIQAKSSVVVVGANGSGKTRFGVWIDLESPQKYLVHRVGAQKSLSIPEYCSTSSKEKERLVSAIVAARIEDNFSKFNAKVIGELELVKSLNALVSSIDIPSLYTETNNLVDTVLSNRNYSAALQLYNNKGLLPQVSSLFGFKTNKDTNELINYIKRLIKGKNNEIILEAFQKSVIELADLNLVQVQATASDS